MRYTKQSIHKDVKKKNMIKILRTILEITFCLTAIIMIIIVAFFPKEYKKPDKTKWGQNNGFIALSYTGVSQNNNEKLISQSQLNSHLKTLYDFGYVTIDIQDIVNYYKYGGLLPDKALFLMFEDGRIDSSLFAQPVLEKYNFKAVMFTYASNVEGGDRLFLKKGDLDYLDNNSYWEIGSNGYRFSYINVYKKISEGSGDNDSNLDMRYTHYLMDYLRDEDDIPLESKKQMQQRITWDYDEMNRIYTDVLGYQPEVYMIMRANTLLNNMNLAVEEINLKNIYKYFKLMFNREELCYNSKDDSIYNLTRMQVQPDWAADRLLAEIEENVRER